MILPWHGLQLSWWAILWINTTLNKPLVKSALRDKQADCVSFSAWFDLISEQNTRTFVLSLNVWISHSSFWETGFWSPFVTHRFSLVKRRDALHKSCVTSVILTYEIDDTNFSDFERKEFIFHTPNRQRKLGGAANIIFMYLSKLSSFWLALKKAESSWNFLL